jgi:FimV-like protein
MAEETQGSYSAQVIWFVAGGILGILIIVMLLRRQMAERKKNLEDAWVGEAESDGGDSRWLDETPLEDGHLDALDSDTERQAKENPAESFEEGAQTIEAPISVQGQEGSFPAEPSIAPVEEAEPGTTETNKTFLDSLDADEMPLEETSNTEVYTTRLKLAEAYLEMGDETGAREMLEEVEAEGDDAQKALAKSIIQRIDDALDDSKDT